MKKYIIEGEHKLSGETTIPSAKNAILPIISACLLADGLSTIHSCPKYIDVLSAIDIVNSLGCNAAVDDEENLHIETASLESSYITKEKSKLMRASFTFLGSLLGRLGHARISEPGGCSIGKRGIDLHIDAFKQMGVSIKEENGDLECYVKKINDSKIRLASPSVGATENIMLLASSSPVTTVIENPAREPEIVDLGNALISMGAEIHGLGSPRIEIHGTKNLKPLDYTPIPDRIVAITLLSAAAITGSTVKINNVIANDIKEVIGIFRQMGCKIKIENNSITLTAPEKLGKVDYIRTRPHPGFPTDAQSLIMAVLSTVEGVNLITEDIFENRFSHVKELNKMGANIQTVGNIAIIKGVPKLKGKKVQGTDLRATAALLIAALSSKGKTELTGINHLERGYINLQETLNKLGAHIEVSTKAAEINIPTLSRYILPNRSIGNGFSPSPHSIV